MEGPAREVDGSVRPFFGDKYGDIWRSLRPWGRCVRGGNTDAERLKGLEGLEDKSRKQPGEEQILLAAQGRVLAKHPLVPPSGLTFLVDGM